MRSLARGVLDFPGGAVGGTSPGLSVLRHRAARHNPFHDLACGRANELELGVVVQHSDAMPLVDRGLQQVWQSRCAVLASTREQLQDIGGARNIGLLERQTRIATQLLADGQEIGMAASAVEHPQLEHARNADLAGFQQREEARGDARVGQARQGALADQVSRLDQRQAAAIASGLSRSTPSMACRRSASRRRASRAMTSSRARWTVAFRPRVPKMAPARATSSSSTSRVVLRTLKVYLTYSVADLQRGSWLVSNGWDAVAGDGCGTATGRPGRGAALHWRDQTVRHAADDVTRCRRHVASSERGGWGGTPARRVG